jgi:hypothetical protein
MMFERLKDIWLTWRTGIEKKEREYLAWQTANICVTANDATNYFCGFKHVIPVDYNKVHTVFEPMWGDYLPNREFLSYMWPNRELGQNCSYRIFRGYWDPWDGRFHINDLRCELDQLFIATNSDEDAVLIALKWA